MWIYECLQDGEAVDAFAEGDRDAEGLQDGPDGYWIEVGTFDRKALALLSQPVRRAVDAELEQWTEGPACKRGHGANCPC